MKLPKTVLTPPILAISAILVFALQAESRTVALWPLNGTEGGKIDARCAINPANDLHVSSYAVLKTEAPDWTLPQNPDGGVHVFPPYNDGCSVACNQCTQWAGDHGSNYTSSPSLFDALCVTNEVTVEGWAKITEWPTDGYPGGELFEAYYGGNTLFFSARYDAKTSELYFDAYYRGNAKSGSPGGDYLFGKGKLNDLYGDTDWHHYAVVLSREKGTPYISVYVDGELIDKKSTSNVNTVDLSTENMLTLGGRNGLTGINARINKIQLDYWRISDTALDPSEFLYSAVKPATHYDYSKKTLAYWPLRKDGEGKLDVKDYAGSADLEGINGWEYGPSLRFGDSAFTGKQPPNPKSAAFDIDNADSILLSHYPQFLRLDHCAGGSGRFGGKVSFETYYKSARIERVVGYPKKPVGTLFTDMKQETTDRGFALQLVYPEAEGGECKWKLIWLDTNSTFGDESTYVACGEFTGGRFNEYDGVWRHVALTGDIAKDDATGTWTGTYELFVDGVSAGTVSSTRPAIDRGGDNGGYLYIGGNKTAALGQLYGQLDCLGAYEGTILLPKNMMCYTGVDAAAPANLKTWYSLDGDPAAPHRLYTVNVTKQGWFCIGSSTGNRSYDPVACADGPTVTNPDPLFDQTGAEGSATFSDGSAGAYALLVSRNERVLDFIADGTRAMTMEAFVKARSAVTSGFRLWFRTVGDNCTQMYSLRAGNQVYITEPTVGATGDNKCDADPDFPINEWVHVAFVRKGDSISYYKNGVLQKTFTNAGRAQKLLGPWYFFIGGRADANTWVGEMAEVRLTHGALDPSEFLCAAVPQTRNPPPAEADGTKAFWYLDNAEGAAVLDNATLAGGYAFAGSALGRTAAAPRPNRRADDSGLFDDTRRPNAGSVAPDESALTAVGLGSRLETTSAFTVEGWAKPAAALDAAEFLCGTWDGAKGWSVSLAPGTDGAASIVLTAANALNAYADATLADAIPAGLLAGWFHFAVTYDPSVGKGTWTFFADGQELGSLENTLQPAFGTYGAADFTLGGDSGFWAGFDLWRVSQGVRSVETMLWREAPGFLLMLR